MKFQWPAFSEYLLYNDIDEGRTLLSTQIVPITNELIDEIASELEMYQREYGYTKFGHVATFAGLNLQNCCTTCLICGKALLRNMIAGFYLPELHTDIVTVYFTCEEDTASKTDENNVAIRRKINTVKYSADRYNRNLEDLK
jgi:hypothetical protein